MNQQHSFWKEAANWLFATAGVLYVMCLLAPIVVQPPLSEIQTVFFGAAAIAAVALVLRNVKESQHARSHISVLCRTAFSAR